MRIVFWGTPRFAAHSLNELVLRGYNVVAAVTTPDKEKGRGLKVSFSDVKQTGLNYNIPVLQPESLKDPDFIKELLTYQPDIFVVVAFRILPKEILSLPVKSIFNLHGSLLPALRGAAPIQWALINGYTKTGVTTFEIEPKVDTGKVYIRKETEILPEDNFGTLHDRLMMLGTEAICETINMIQSGSFTLLPQNDELATPAPKITKEICRIDFTRSAEEIHNLIRGLSPAPGAFFEYNSKQIKIYTSGIVDRSDLKPGESEILKSGWTIGCGSNALLLLEIQPEGKRRMSAEEYIRGLRI
ncbi:MAG: Methionyl-tRNA formyltransferase [Ignavibacteriaceae bacterium]|nr:Methionyl-tRNA formyltransferase [Ignavibacteriaceae bacterium]